MTQFGEICWSCAPAVCCTEKLLSFRRYTLVNNHAKNLIIYDQCANGDTPRF